MRAILVFFWITLWPGIGAAQGPWRLDAGLTVSRFEQQVKTEVGGARGDRLVENSEIGLLHMLTYNVWGPLDVGVFQQLDAGKRSAGRFVAFDANGAPLVEGEIGGSYLEMWAGPVIRAHWRKLFVELGYGALGRRHDTARSDLPSESGDTSGALRTHPTIAWMFGLGGAVPVTDELSVALRVEYRVRYYDRRGGHELADETVHGTQNLTPFMGIAWNFGD